MTARWPRAVTVACAAAALVGFAANSLFARVALGDGLTDPATFTLVRLVSGALVLAALAVPRRRRSAAPAARPWLSAAALFIYAAAFSFAYVSLGASVGALILFGAVQATMIGWGLVSGERPHLATWCGLTLALAGLFILTAPGLQAPPPAAAALMAAAGIAWGVYSLRGRGSADPLTATAANFVWSVPPALALSVGFIGTIRMTGEGLALALASGALASGVGYSFWYAALPSLTATQAAISQLIVPVLTAAAAVWLLGEPITLRLVVSGAAIAAGVLLALAGGRRPARS